MDTQDKPNMSIYQAVGEAINKAKLTTIPTQKEPTVEYEDDHAPEEYYTAQLIQLGILKGFQECASEHDYDSPHEKEELKKAYEENNLVSPSAKTCLIKEISYDEYNPTSDTVGKEKQHYKETHDEPYPEDQTPQTELHYRAVEDHTPNPDDHVVTIINRIIILQRDINCLNQGNWINDKIVDASLWLLQQQHRSLDLLCISSYFITKLLEGGVYSYDNVRRWQIKIHNYKTIAIPINLSNNHWTMALINMTEKSISYFDSVNGNGQFHIEAILRFIKDDELNKNITPSTWSCHQIQDIPQQTNSYDCGIYMIAAIEKYTTKLPLDYTPEDIASKRKDIQLRIINYKE
jgi:Ulp1 family protease